MRSDGYAAFYRVQHQNSRDEWTETALDEILFRGLSYEEAHGKLAERLIELLRPQDAGSDLWQKYGIHGFIEQADAEAVLTACRERRPTMKFRLVRRQIVQLTEVVENG